MNENLSCQRCVALPTALLFVLSGKYHECRSDLSVVGTSSDAMTQVFHPGQLEHPGHRIDRVPPHRLHLSRVSAHTGRQPVRVWTHNRLRWLR